MNLSQRRYGGVSLTVLLQTVIVLALLQQSEGIQAAEKEYVDKGFAAGKEILDYINNKDFAKTLTKLTGAIAPFLGALGPFLGFVLAFIPSQDSAELAYMKKMMGQIDNRFNVIDNRFNDIERLIDWTKVAVNFGQIEQNINAMHSQYITLYSTNQPSENAKQLFIINYNSVYQLSALKLYQAITQTHGTFQENLGKSVMRYTANDRKKTQEFLLGTLRLLLQAVEIEIAYYYVSGFEKLAETNTELWNTRIQEVKRNFEAIDKAVKNKYLDQSAKDIKEFSANKYGQSNERFVKDGYDMLKQKYYWRDWFVVAYNLKTASTANMCGGQRMFDKDGRHFVTSSVESNHSKKGRATLKKRLDSLGSYAYTKNWVGKKSARDTSEVFDKIDKSGTCSLVVLKKNNGAWWIGLPDRYAHVDNGYQDLLLFA
ncbi:unnamed protein product [Owenia fusiformis]|uniref:Uncharacterized protein n=1 Tax=Owenia fusiformis TaxID=6347 RepID=A0A8J1TM98_OWEFU|nr:unnamed protein product [Owenia fusiformis]